METPRLRSQRGHIMMTFFLNFDLVALLCDIYSRKNVPQYRWSSSYQKINVGSVVPAETLVTSQRMAGECDGCLYYSAMVYRDD
jgi:hypothetical protein